MSEGVRRSGYTIAALSRLTGVSCHALRAWERRYGFPVPDRSTSGHRRYAPELVALIKLAAECVRQGRPVHEVMAELRAGKLVPARPSVPAAPAVASPAAGLLDHLRAGNLHDAEREYQRLAEGRELADLATSIIEPCLVDVGEQWFRGESSVFQEHAASHFLRRKLSELISIAQRDNVAPGRRILLGTVPGERHEGGVLILGLLLELAGWRAIILGVDLPVSEFRAAVAYWRPDALGLSFVLSRNINKWFRELREIDAAPVFVGGRSLVNYQGLARRHGLIPIPGPAARAVALLQEEAARWWSNRDRP